MSLDSEIVVVHTNGVGNPVILNLWSWAWC